MHSESASNSMPSCEPSAEHLAPRLSAWDARLKELWWASIEQLWCLFAEHDFKHNDGDNMAKGHTKWVWLGEAGYQFQEGAVKGIPHPVLVPHNWVEYDLDPKQQKAQGLIRNVSYLRHVFLNIQACRRNLEESYWLSDKIGAGYEVNYVGQTEERKQLTAKVGEIHAALFLWEERRGVFAPVALPPGCSMAIGLGVR